MTPAPGEASPHILAIDMGTGTAKAALVSRRGRIAAAAIREIEMLHLPGGGAEQDPEQWWRVVVEAAREALERSGLAPESVVAVRCATQWAVTVPVDAEGRALANAISWMDTRGGPYVRELVGGPVKVAGYSVAKLPRWLRLTGGAPVLSGIDGLGHLLYLQERAPRGLRGGGGVPRADGLPQPAALRPLRRLVRDDLPLLAHRQPRREPTSTTTGCCFAGPGSTAPSSPSWCRWTPSSARSRRRPARSSAWGRRPAC